ncbi:MAG TPA: AbrB/MazE/SpoVT family DNA-binding domain-containing protein [Thermoanaerobaculia bacterium]|nr:AbrB/MazE/SpoVT family DNA-binding domain-containing protein [Thermoanaerobaculia bacterium]
MSDISRVRLSSRGQFVIPKSHRDALGLEEGSELVILRREDTLVLIRAEDFAEATRGRLRGVWGRSAAEVEAYLSGERGSWD